MGFIARVLSFRRGTRQGITVGEVTVDPGGNRAVTLDHLGAPGDDSPPLATDKAGGLPVDGSGRAVAVGYLDVVNAGSAVPGEKRFYARDSAGVEVSSLFMAADGSIRLGNANGFIEITAGGSIRMNQGGPVGITVSTTGILSAGIGGIDTTGDVTGDNGGANISLNSHDHSAGTYLDSGAGNVTGDSGAPN